MLDQNQQPLKLEVTDVEKLQEESESEGDDYDTDDTDSTEDDTDLPKVSVYTFSNPSRLLSVGDNEYKAQDGMEASLKSDAVLQKRGTGEFRHRYGKRNGPCDRMSESLFLCCKNDHYIR